MMSLQEAINNIAARRGLNYLYIRAYMAMEFPNMTKALKIIDDERTRIKVPKGFNLTKRESKALGFVYYVRYWHDKKLITSKWCAHTNNYAEAVAFAIKNRNRLIKRYFANNGSEVDKFFKGYYDNQTKVYRIESARNGELSEVRRQISLSFMRKKFVPFLRGKGIRRFEEITVPVLDDLQDKLLADGIKPQTINDNIGMINKAFKYLVRKGYVEVNPCAGLQALRVKPGDKKTHGCYELIKVRGVFDKEWEDKLSYILNLLIHTTDMRNSEVMSIRKSDIVEYHGVKFIDLKSSKSESGIRLVPLHPFVYEKLKRHIKCVKDDAAIFAGVSAYRFSKAAEELAVQLGVSESFLRENNITYYSGRHFWKTLMSSEGLGADIEEVFMGHKVSNDVSKLYNHRYAAGKKLIVKKAREVFRILDRRLFNIKV